MADTEDNLKLPILVNIPDFIINDDRLDKIASIVASLIYYAYQNADYLPKTIHEWLNFFCEHLPVSREMLFSTIHILKNLEYIKINDKNNIAWEFIPTQQNN